MRYTIYINFGGYMDRNRWLIFAGLCVAVITGLVMVSSKEKVDVSSIDGTKIDTTSEIKDHVIGDVNSKIVVIEYADYQCPGCHAAYPQVKAISDEYKGSVAFIFRNFPLTSIHPNALAAASAAEAAGLQGKYWEMHDSLFLNQDTWKAASADQRDARFQALATQLGINIDQFRTDVTSKEIATKIDTDRALGIKMGVSSTPTIFVNGKLASEETVSNVMSSNGDALRDQLDRLIKENGGTPPTRTTTQ